MAGEFDDKRRGGLPSYDAPGYDDEPAERPWRPRVAPGKMTRSARAYSHVLRAAAATGPVEADPERLDAASRSSGQPLPTDLRTELEHSLGASLAAVRVHTGAESADAAQSIQARAYTTGNDIHFAPGTWDPSSDDGRRLIAHEVAHTVQQTHAPAVQTKLEVSSPGDALEVEADRFADAFVEGATAPGPTTFGVTSAAEGAVQRKEAEHESGAGSAGSSSGVKVQIPKSSLKIPLQKKVIAIGGKDVTLSIGAEVGKKRGVVEKTWGSHDQTGDLEASVKLLEPQLDIVGAEAATSFLKGGGAATLFSGLVVKVEGAGPGWSVSKTGVKGQLAAIVVKFEGNVPELFDQIGRPELRDQIDIKVSGQVQIPFASFDDAALVELVAEGERLFRHLDEMDAKQARLTELVEKDRALAAKKAATVKTAETGGKAAKGVVKHEYHQIEKQIRKNRDEIWKLTQELKSGGEKIAEHRGRMGKFAAKISGKLGRAVSKSLVALAKTAVGRFIGRLLPIINIISFGDDVVAILHNIVFMVEAEFELFGGGADGLGGGSETNPDVESNEDGHGAAEDVGTETGTGGERTGAQGGGGSDPTSGGRGGATGGTDSAEAAQGSGQRTGSGAVPGGAGRDENSRAGAGTDPSAETDGGGGQVASGDVALSLEAKMLLAQSRLGNQGLDDETRRRLNQLVGSLGQDELEKLVEALGDWKPGSGAELVAELKQAIAGLHAESSKPSGTPGTKKSPPASGKGEEGNGSGSTRRRKSRGPGQGGDESGAGGKDKKPNPLQRDHVFPVDYELIQQIMGPLLDSSGQLSVSPREADHAIVLRAGELLEGAVRKGPRGMATFIDVDGATTPKNVAGPGESPRWEFHLLLLVEIDGKRTTDLHRLTYEPTQARAQEGYHVDYTAIAEQLEVKGNRISLKVTGVVVPIGTWRGKLLGVRWDKRPGGKASVDVLPLPPVKQDERIGSQRVLENERMWIVVGE